MKKIIVIVALAFVGLVIGLALTAGNGSSASPNFPIDDKLVSQMADNAGVSEERMREAIEQAMPMCESGRDTYEGRELTYDEKQTCISFAAIANRAK